MDTEIHTEEYKGYTVKIHLDDGQPDSPRDWVNLGTIIAWHRRYDLSDADAPKNMSPDEFVEWATAEGYPYFSLFMYEHSGVALSLSGFSCPWDSGQVGYVYVTPEKIRECFGDEKPTDEKIRECLESEIDTYSSYLNGEVYGYVVESPDGESIDSCWGFISETDYPLQEAKEIVDAHIVEMDDAENFVAIHFAL